MDMLEGELALREITEANRVEIESLSVTEAQSAYVADNADSLIEAAETPGAMPWYRGVYVGDVRVGFVMISDNIPRERTEYLGPYFLWRIMIDTRWQGRGYGTQALELVLDHIRQDPEATELLCSLVPGTDSSPRGWYFENGFRLRGDWFDGEEVIVRSL